MVALVDVKFTEVLFKFRKKQNTVDAYFNYR
jgi:hypothetical protein